MSNKTIPGIFITGTNTEVGKTYAGAIIARCLARRGYRVGVYKPAASGCIRQGETLVSEDALALWQAAGQPSDLEFVCPQRFEAAIAPHLAAHQAGTAIDTDLLRSGLDHWLDCSDVVLIEGAGGLMSPISDEDFVADLAYDFEFPVVVVSPNVLGVINQTLQTLITAATFRDGLDVVGVVLNDLHPGRGDQSITSNRSELERLCVPPVLAQLSWQAQEFDTEVDWYKLACGRRTGHSA